MMTRRIEGIAGNSAADYGAASTVAEAVAAEKSVN
jgi:hypothetical protein